MTAKKAKAKPKVKVKPKTKKHAGGRPTKMTPATVTKLETAFLMGCTDVEACLFADITKTCLYNYQEKHPEFVDRKEMLKTNPVMKARGVLLDALKDDDRNIANKMIDRKEGSKVAVTGAEGGPLEMVTKDMDDKTAARLFKQMVDAGRKQT